MAKLNRKVASNETTHEGSKTPIINAKLMLRRSVMSCMLWENSFYESGIDIAQRIKDLVHSNKPQDVADIAIEAREKMKLRHIPLLLVRELARHKDRLKIRVSETLARVIQRADELCEFVAIYWQEKRQPLSKQVKKGLAQAFTKFSVYDLAKYNRDEAVKLRDVLFLCHAKPISQEQEDTWKKLIAGTLEAPDTWEVALSAGKDKKETWERLIKENRLGALALLRNLRNMKEAMVNEDTIFHALETMKVDRVLPFRFITSARYAPQWEPQLESAMLKCLLSQEKMGGKTVLLIDVSGSMDNAISDKSEVTGVDAACGIAILLREICERIEVLTFSEKVVQIPARRGFALRDAINNSQSHSSTYLGRAIQTIDFSITYDRLIVITDEQSADSVPTPKNKGYMINVRPYRNGVGYGAWTHIDGFSEGVIDYIRQFEGEI